MLLGVRHLRHLAFHSTETKSFALACRRRTVYLAALRETCEAGDWVVHCMTRAKAHARQRCMAAYAIVQDIGWTKNLT
ncbi:MAG TPA: hypothetical protein DEO91_09920 [Pseudomonas sp.]|nr:hypothetical protein [Pseudomonas sp.]